MSADYEVIAAIIKAARGDRHLSRFECVLKIQTDLARHFGTTDHMFDSRKFELACMSQRQAEQAKITPEFGETQTSVEQRLAMERLDAVGIAYDDRGYGMFVHAPVGNYMAPREVLNKFPDPR